MSLVTALIILVALGIVIIAAVVAAASLLRRAPAPQRRPAAPLPGLLQRRPAAPLSVPLLAPTPELITSPAPGPALPYARIPQLLTPAERDLLVVLQQAVPPGLQIFAQVRLANLVQVQRRAGRDKTHWYKIQAKCVDFVLCAADSAPRLVVELDDRSHDRPDRRERDAFVDAVLAGVGLPILHIRWQRRYDPQVLAGQLATALAAPAPTPAQPAAPGPAAPHRACGACQAELRPGARFCSHCGAIVVGA